MNMDIITENIAIDSTTIIAVNATNGTIHLDGGITLSCDAHTIKEMLARLALAHKERSDTQASPLTNTNQKS